ncbi:hypothetical protein QTP70_005876 [Hemibagrus guttatus]|uniref:ribonuclease H n=1 Tax=Hemibagrus guttatus TaxID=175788 RepID=A0AAE0QLP5_9TELE|nr:hypothetical protein QTP70_005876 [Hemibagrus guttatus]
MTVVVNPGLDRSVNVTTCPRAAREAIRSYQDQVEALQSQLRSASTAAPRDPPAARGESPRLAMAEKFDGSADRCRGFLRQCEVFFSHQPGIYHEEGTRCAFLLSLLTSRALEWASAVWDADPQIRSSFSYFAGMIREVFEYPAGGKNISIQLMELCQGSGSAADYAIKFRTLAAHARLNPARTTCCASIRLGHSPQPQPGPECGRITLVLGRRFLNLCSWEALIDSGAAVNLIDGALVEELEIPTFPCVPSLKITAIDSQLIGEGYLKRQTELLEFWVGLFHQEQLPFYVTSSPANPVILGFPWLLHHDPQISYRSGELDFLREGDDSRSTRSHSSRLCGLFSEERAARLPSHQAWDCAIDLLPNTSPPRGRVYPLSLPEAKAMEDYIEAALAAGHIRPSTSLAAVGFFFVGKKDGGLQPCIDYQGLEAVTVRYPYPLPLVPAALEPRGERFFYQVGPQERLQPGSYPQGGMWKTAFHMTHGHYEYRVMPFGLTNAPAVFQALINGVFQDLLGKWVIAYIDDILVYIYLHGGTCASCPGGALQTAAAPPVCKTGEVRVMFLGYVVS